jgi:hypothetical protein
MDQILSSFAKCYYVEIMLACRSKCSNFRKNVVMLDQMMSCEAKLSCGTKCVIG